MHFPTIFVDTHGVGAKIFVETREVNILSLLTTTKQRET